MTYPQSPKRLLMVMPYHQLVRKAVAAGFTVVSVWDPALNSPAYLDEVRQHSEELLLTDFTDTAGLRTLLRETATRLEIDCVLHLGSEASMPPVLAEAEALGLSMNPARAVHLLNDKAAMRGLLNEHGLSAVRARPAPTVADVRDAVREADLPVIVKPAASAGSRGVALVRHPGDLEEWVERVGQGGLAGPYLVEEYLEGPEFSVETLSADGVHHVIGVTAKRTTGAPCFVETGHVFPAALAEQDRAAVHAVVTGLLELAGYRFGPAHTEVVLTARGPRIVESQSRLGGDRIPLLVEAATGFDVESWIFRALAGQAVAPPEPQRCAAVEFFRLPPGRLEEVRGVGEIASLPHVHAVVFPFAPGDTLPRTTSSATRHGYVVVDAATPAEAAERITAATHLLKTTVAAEPAEDHSPLLEGQVR
jgi:biotin carboxylase